MHEENSSTSGSASWPGVELSSLAPARAEALRHLIAATELLCAAGSSADERPDGVEATAVADVIAAAVSRLTAAKIRLLPVIEADGRWATGGRKSFARWVSDRQHVAIRTAGIQAKTGRILRDHLPATADAAATGAITVEHAQVLAQVAPTTEQRREILADPGNEVNEAFLVEQAGRMDVEDLRQLVRRWAAYTDPDADDRGYVETSDREHLEICRVADMYDIRGLLTVDHGQQVKAALAAITPVRAAGDERDTAQRRAQALADLAKVVLDHELAGSGRTVRPRINVLVDYPTFEKLTARAQARAEACGTQGQLTVDGPTRTPSFATAAMLTGDAITGGPQYEDGTTICRAALDLLACDSAIGRFIFGAKSEVLDVGRAERTFTGPRRAALIARDKHCRYPGCTAPPILCDGHHIDHWVRDHGRTAVHRGVLLCTFHHKCVHDHKIEISTRGKRFIFTDRHGYEITADNHRPMPSLE